METMQSRFRLNELDAAASVVEGEAIMMNLANGVYYSTDGAGARIWELAAAEYSPNEIAEILTREYDVSPEQARADALALVGQFVDEKLLIASNRTTGPTLPPPGPDNPKGAYTRPTLEIYREMGHLLALDPPLPGLENLVWDDSPSDPNEKSGGKDR
jgi:hypothetical protein